MAKNKDQDFKEFLFSQRRSLGAGLGTVPVWVLRKANKRLSSPRQKRTWKQADLGMLYEKRAIKALHAKKKRAGQKGRKPGKRKD